jgi:hypothetical protein
MLTGKIYRYKKGKRIPGIGFPAIVNNFHFYLTTIVVYADGLIDCWGLMDFDEFKRKLKSGWITINLPPNSELHIYNLGVVNSTEFRQQKSNNDFVKEIEDCILELNGKESRRQKCIRLFKTYLLTNSKKFLKELKTVFNDLPFDKRVIFDYAEEKDSLFILMTSDKLFSVAERKSILNDYFENAWDEDEFK